MRSHTKQEKFYLAIHKIQKYFNKFFDDLENIYGYKSGEKLSVRDIFAFYLLYTQNGKTQQDVVNIFKDKRDINVTRQAFIKRFEKLKQEHIYSFFTGLKKILNIKVPNNMNFIAVDGTFINIYDRDKNNTKGYQKKCILGLINTTSNIPYDIYTSYNHESSEMSLFESYLDKEKFSSNDTLILDRLYFSKKLHSKFIEKKVNFVCRLKITSILLNQYKLKEKVKKNNPNFNENDYITLYNDQEIRVVTYNVKQKVFHVATSLSNTNYSVNSIAKLYKDRWNVEVMFKHVKKTSTVDNIVNISKKVIDTKIYFSFVVNMITSYLINVYYESVNNSSKKVNVSNFIKEFYDKLLYNLLTSYVSLRDVCKIYDIIIVLYLCKSYDASYERKSIMPYTKWHYKSKFKDL